MLARYQPGKPPAGACAYQTEDEVSQKRAHYITATAP